MTQRDHFDEMYDDIHHLLWWLARGLFFVAVLSAIEAVESVRDHDWLGVGISGAIVVVMAIASWRTDNRADAYRQALHMRAESTEYEEQA
jgi:hypothetical protein